MSFEKKLARLDWHNVDSVDNYLNSTHVADINVVFRHVCHIAAPIDTIARVMWDGMFDIRVAQQHSYYRKLFRHAPTPRSVYLKTLLESYLRTPQTTSVQMVFEGLLKVELKTLHLYSPHVQWPLINRVLRYYLNATDHTMSSRSFGTFKSTVSVISKLYEESIPSVEIGRGGYGTVVRPALHCRGEGKRQTANTVGKIMRIHHAEAEESNVTQLALTKYDPDYVHHVKFFRSCEPTAPFTMQRMLIYEYGGLTLHKLMALKTTAKKDIILGLEKLFRWVIHINEFYGIYHMDIKAENIVCILYRGALQCRLIDWGMAVRCREPHVPPARVLYSKPYTWPFELTLYSPNVVGYEERVAAYRKVYGRHIPYKDIYKTYISVVDWLQNDTTKVPYRRIEKLFSFVDIHQFALLLAHPHLIGRKGRGVSRILKQCKVHPTLQWVRKFMFI